MEQKTGQVVINADYGGFHLSVAAQNRLRQLGYRGDCEEIVRHDKCLVQVVKDLGEKASGQCSQLKIVEIPIEWLNYYLISDYGGLESVECDYKRFLLDKIECLTPENALW